MLTWAAFFLAFISALLHLVIDASWLIFFTILPPVLSGILHGTNGFLGIIALSIDHQRIHAKLEEFSIHLSEMPLKDLASPQAHDANVSSLGSEIYSVLTNTVLAWEDDIAKKQKLMPA